MNAISLEDGFDAYKENTVNTEIAEDTSAKNTAIVEDLQFVKLENGTYALASYGYIIPNIVAHRLTDAEIEDQGYQENPDQWHLIIDGRFGKTFSRNEVRKMAWFLANAMAVSAGFTRFGEHSRPVNPFQQKY